MFRKTQAIINLNHLSSNFALAEQWAPQSKNIAVIKANAYGHGLVEVAKQLEKEVPAFAVAIFDEAIKLREQGIIKPILVLQGFQTQQEIKIASENDFWLMIHSPQQLNMICDHSIEPLISSPIKLWIKVDTGMHRLGFDGSMLTEIIAQITSCQWLKNTMVIASHFSCASESNNPENKQQLDQFNRYLKNAPLAEGLSLSLANSPAIVSLPESHFDWNRPGLLLYGLALFDIPHESDEQLKPVMNFVSEVISVREIQAGEYVGYGKTWQAERKSIIASVAVGYADGYPRQAINGTPVLISNQRVPLVGVVSMDSLSVDVTDISSVAVGDKVELWGSLLPANEVAKYANTIGYDLISGVSNRVPRIYIK